MEISETAFKVLLIFIGALLLVICASLSALPEKLNDGCIVYESDIYCKEER